MKSFSAALSLLSAKERRDGVWLLPLICVRGFADMIGVAIIFPFLKVITEPELVETNTYLAWAYSAFGFETIDVFVSALGLALIAVTILVALFKLFTNYIVLRWLELRVHAISSRLLTAYLRQPYEMLLRRHSSELVTLMMSETTRIVKEVYQPLADALISTVTLVFIVGLLVVVDPTITFFAILTLSIVYATVVLLVRRLSSRLGTTVLEMNRQRYRFATDSLTGAKQIRLLNREATMLQSYRGASKQFAEALATSRIVRTAPRFLVEGIMIGAGILLCLILLARNGGVSGTAVSETLPLLGLFAIAGFRMIPAFQKGYLSIVSLRLANAALDAVVNEFKDSAAFPALAKEPAEPLRFNRNIELRSLSYAYPGASAPSLCGLSLIIPAGSSVGIVGETGAGKSTLMDTLLGLLLPTEGQLLIDDAPLDHEMIRRWRANVGYVPQDIFLSDASIAENIAFGVPKDKIDGTRVREAARLAQIEQFIEKELPERFDTLIGERGVRLSGGQRQRISIARALYTEPEVIAFDEATSALDNATEASVMEEISRLAGSRTLIMVAHRLTTVRNCDMIVTLNGGRIEKVGTYDDLVGGHNSTLAPTAIMEG